MAWPMVAPAPIVIEHAMAFRDLFENLCQCRPFQHDLAGLIVRPHNSPATIARCILDSADNTHLACCLVEAPWREDAVNTGKRRWRSMAPRSQFRTTTGHALASLSRGARCCSRTSSVGPAMRRFGPQSRWPLSWWKPRSGTRCPLGWWSARPGPDGGRGPGLGPAAEGLAQPAETHIPHFSM
jgi:hypothetical protein